jgi:CheY-like chemotaxis protein
MANEKRQKRVLYVEASDLVQASHGPVFERLNCSIFQVASANAAIEALETEEPFDLVLVGDLSKPVDDEDPQPELSVIAKARKLSATVPILIFTSHNYLDDAYRTGATGHLLKPAGIFDMIEFVTPYLLSSRSSRRSEERDSGDARQD